MVLGEAVSYALPVGRVPALSSDPMYFFFFFFFFFIVISPRIRHLAWRGPPYGAASMYNEVT